MKVESLVNIIGFDFFAGVPDSQLKVLCNYLMDRYVINPKRHIIAANEGNCTAIAAGYHLATGKVPMVYMRNSGEVNIINPVRSLLNDKVYAIPMIFIISQRGESGIHDESQHIYQGEVTVKLLKDMNITTFIIGKDTTDDEVENTMKEFQKVLAQRKDVAFIIRKFTLDKMNEIGALSENSIKNMRQFYGESSLYANCQSISYDLDVNGEGFMIEIRRPMAGDIDWSEFISLGFTYYIEIMSKRKRFLHIYSASMNVRSRRGICILSILG